MRWASIFVRMHKYWEFRFEVNCCSHFAHWKRSYRSITIHKLFSFPFEHPANKKLRPTSWASRCADFKANRMQWIAINICCIVISLIISALKHDKQTNFCWPTEQKFKKVKHFKSEIFSHSYMENWMDCLLAGFVCCFWTLWADHCAVNNSTFSNYQTTFYLKFILHLRALLNPGFVE